MERPHREQRGVEEACFDGRSRRAARAGARRPPGADEQVRERHEQPERDRPNGNSLRADRRRLVADDDGVPQHARRVARPNHASPSLTSSQSRRSVPGVSGATTRAHMRTVPPGRHGGRQRRPRTFEPGVRAVRLPPVIREPDRSAGRPGLRAGVVQLEDGGRRLAARERGWRVDRLKAGREARGPAPGRTQRRSARRPRRRRSPRCDARRSPARRTDGVVGPADDLCWQSVHSALVVDETAEAVRRRARPLAGAAAWTVGSSAR